MGGVQKEVLLQNATIRLSEPKFAPLAASGHRSSLLARMA
jgi:hypothetical protein